MTPGVPEPLPGMNSLELRTEALDIVKRIKVLGDGAHHAPRLRFPDMTFLKNMVERLDDPGFIPTRKQIFWLRDIHEKAGE